MATNLHPSGISQCLALTLFRHWGLEGFLKHTSTVAKFYKNKCETFISLCHKHLTGLCEWNTPTAGMFVWLRLNNITDSSKLIREKAVDKKVLLVPGVEFLPNQAENNCVRASFSIATAEEMDLALNRLKELLTEEKEI